MAVFEQVNLNDALPIAPAGKKNVKWQADPPTVVPRNISAYVDPPGAAGSVAVVVTVPLMPIYAGNFTVPHGAGSIPSFVLIEMTSGGQIWLQSPTGFDATNLYLVASDAGVTGVAYVWVSPPDGIVPFTSVAGNFSIPHALGAVPIIGLIEFDSGGAVWFQNPLAFDSALVYLVGGDNGITGRVILWKEVPNLTTSDHVAVNLAPGAPGNFKVAHGLGVTPTVLLIEMTSTGAIWFQSPIAADSTYIYLTASFGGITGTAQLWSGTGGVTPTVSAITVVALAPSVGGNFTVAHGAPAKPKAVIIEMTSAGAIWFQTPTEYDATNLYLVASDGPLTASAKVLT